MLIILYVLQVLLQIHKGFPTLGLMMVSYYKKRRCVPPPGITPGFMGDREGSQGDVPVLRPFPSVLFTTSAAQMLPSTCDSHLAMY